MSVVNDGRGGHRGRLRGVPLAWRSTLNQVFIRIVWRQHPSGSVFCKMEGLEGVSEQLGRSVRVWRDRSLAGRCKAFEIEPWPGVSAIERPCVVYAKNSIVRPTRLFRPADFTGGRNAQDVGVNCGQHRKRLPWRGHKTQPRSVWYVYRVCRLVAAHAFGVSTPRGCTAPTV